MKLDDVDKNSEQVSLLRLYKLTKNYVFINFNIIYGKYQIGYDCSMFIHAYCYGCGSIHNNASD